MPIYAKPEFGVAQMAEIRRGLKSGLDVSVYAHPAFGWGQMKQLRYGLLSGVDVRVYAQPEFDAKQMLELRMGLEEGLDVSRFADPTLDADAMRAARYRLMVETSDNITIVTFGAEGDAFTWFPEPVADVEQKYVDLCLDQVTPVRVDGAWLVPEDMVVDMIKEHDASTDNYVPHKYDAVVELVALSDVKGLGKGLSDLGDISSMEM